MTQSSPTREILRRESLYLLAGILGGFVCVPSIGTVYYREDIAIGYRQFLGALFDAETWFSAVAYVLAPYLLVLLARAVVWVWHRIHPNPQAAPAPQ